MSELVDAARALAAGLPKHRASHEATRRLDGPVVARARDAGLFAMMLPRELGGGEASLGELVGVVEALARGDAATGWVVMTAATTCLLAPYLPRAAADAIWQDKSVVMAGVFAPTGRLDGGRLVGRWAYCSGCQHADWLALGAVDADKRVVTCFVPAENATIVDNWDTLGLAGTGSHDVKHDGAVEHVASVFDARPWSDAPLYRAPLFGVLALGVAAVASGIAQAALAQIELKDPSSSTLAAWAHARARADAASAYLAAAAARADRGEMRLAASHVSAEAADVVRAAFRLAGGGAARAGHPLGSALRDVETALTHRMVAARVVPAAARAMLGIGTPPPDL